LARDSCLAGGQKTAPRELADQPGIESQGRDRDRQRRRRGCDNGFCHQLAGLEALSGASGAGGCVVHGAWVADVNAGAARNNGRLVAEADASRRGY
jgi:hypothetical protein